MPGLGTEVKKATSQAGYYAMVGHDVLYLEVLSVIANPLPELQLADFDFQLIKLIVPRLGT